MSQSYVVKFSELLDQEDVGKGLYAIHKALASNGFVDYRMIEEIRVITKEQVEIKRTDGVTMHYRYNWGISKMECTHSTSTPINANKEESQMKI